MVLLLGVNFQETRLVKSVLESFYGIGKQGSAKILARFHIHPLAKVGSLRSQLVTDVQQHLTTLKIEGDLRKQTLANIKTLRDIGSYRGRRHAMSLPVRGQRTRSGQIMTARKLNRVQRRG